MSHHADRLIEILSQCQTTPDDGDAWIDTHGVSSHADWGATDRYLHEEDPGLVSRDGRLVWYDGGSWRDYGPVVNARCGRCRRWVEACEAASEC